MTIKQNATTEVLLTLDVLLRFFSTTNNMIIAVKTAVE